MSDSTAHGLTPRSQRPRRTRRPQSVFVILVIFVAFVSERGPSAVSRQQPPAQPKGSEQKGPVFRVGAHLVTVDAYPTSGGGKIIKDLKPEDFEVYEDGKIQKVEQLAFIDYDTPLPDDDRPVMMSARDGMELAADSRYRVVVIVLDRQAFDKTTWPPVRDALLEYLKKTVEPRDLVGLVTTDDPWESVILGRRLSSIEEQISDPDWLRAPYREDSLVMAGCGMDNMQLRVRADTTFSLLEGLVRMLGQVREDHSSIVFATNFLSRAISNPHGDNTRSMSLPRTGLVNGKIQRIGPDMHQVYCEREKNRLNLIDFDRRFSDLTKEARASNISFYPIAIWNPTPVTATEIFMRGAPRDAAPPAGFRMPVRTSPRFAETLFDLAKATSGFAVPPMGNVTEGLSRIAGDVGSHYMLGYYTNNTKWDGKLRSIRVRLKRTGTEIRARRDYRAPTPDDIAGLAATAKPGGKIVPAPVAGALSVLSAVRPSAQFYAYGAIAGKTMYVTIETPALAVQNGRWKDGAAVDVIAEAPGGDSIGMARGRLAANGRASLQVPIDGTTPPTHMFVRVRAEGESVTQRIAVGADRSILVGDPLAFRSSARGLAIPAASFVFARDEKVRLEWPVLGAVDRYEARLLDRYGLPLKFKIAVEDQPVIGARRLIATLVLTSLGRGDYVVELTAAAGDEKESHYVAIRIN
jgi:VWFA-related protein